jgi:hypothetical protein
MLWNFLPLSDRQAHKVWIPMMVMGDSDFIVMAYSGT